MTCSYTYIIGYRTGSVRWRTVPDRTVMPNFIGPVRHVNAAEGVDEFRVPELLRRKKRPAQLSAIKLLALLLIHLKGDDVPRTLLIHDVLAEYRGCAAITAKGGRCRILTQDLAAALWTMKNHGCIGLSLCILRFFHRIWVKA